MGLLVWIFISVVPAVFSARAGITQCTTGTTFPPTYAVGSPTAPAAGSGIFLHDENFQFTCCGVVEGLTYEADSGGDINAQIWRQTGENSFQLISQNTYTLPAAGSFTPDDNARLSFQEGDQIGWYGAGGLLIKKKTDTSLARVSTTIGALAVGNTFDWSTASVSTNDLYLMQFDVTGSTAPYFKNIDATLSFADTETLIGGITLLTLSVSDLDPEDVAGLFVEMSPEWSDYFDLDISSLVVTTSRKLEPGSYEVLFRVEESHCGIATTSTLTVTVSDSAPSITNLPAFATLHEDTRDETLLYTVTMSDPTNQAMWCKGDWTIGTTGTDKPFIVKMISTAAGDSRAGIYLIEEPSLDYDVTAQFYSLSLTCMDTFGNTDTESFYVNILKNQVPIFTNLGNMVEVDATVVKIGTLVFTVSTTDAENDQITYDDTCTPAADCPFALYGNGMVIVTANLLLWDTFSYTMTITPKDLRDSGTARDLIIYIKNRNNEPTFTNLNGDVTVMENTALGTSLFQVAATDADSDTLTYYMTMNTDQGWGLFEMSSSGQVTTHSTYNIDFESVAATHEMIIYAHDSKEAVSATLTIAVQDVAETLAFTQKTYGLSNVEGAAGVLNTAYIAVIDPDAGDTVTYAMTCGTYDSYFSINPTTAAISFAVEYDLDTGSLPTEVTCSLTATDSTGFNDTADLYIVITYDNEHTPTFSPSTYSATLKSTAPLGLSVLTVTATDADMNDDGEFTYSLVDAPGTSHFLVSITGILYTAKNLSDTTTFGTQTFNILATDGGTTAKNGTAAITITFEDATKTVTTTTDRNREFTEDSRNIYWLTAAVFTVAACMFVIIMIIVRYCMDRTEPLCKDWWTSPKKERKFDKNRRPKPFGRQQKPSYKHIHSKEVLRPSPPPSRKAESAEEDDNFSTRAQSANSLVSGRVNLSQVNLNDRGKAKTKEDDINSWMSEASSPARSVAPERAVTKPRAADRDYIGRGRRRSKARQMTNSPVPPSPSVALPEDLISYSNDRLQPSNSALNVNPSPVLWNNTDGTDNDNYIPSDDDDDFRSEHISIASPVTVHSSPKN